LSAIDHDQLLSLVADPQSVRDLGVYFGVHASKAREDADLTEQISLLRTLDVVVWMRHRNSHRPSRCPGLVP
jgi:hypothetical protein